ncbi:MAG: phosphotransferase [Methylococcaceae bacterium]|nr:phosphotransferase [Methylococcaceae bacterium]
MVKLHNYNNNPYEFLSLEQTKSLPEFSSAKRIASLFDDTTNSSWWLETSTGPLVLKLCDDQWVNESSFWQGMQSLFGLKLPQSMADYNHVYSLISTLSPLTIPRLTQSASCCANGEFPGFLLAEGLDGRYIINSDVTKALVCQLAHHLGQLHQHQQTHWGILARAEFDPSQWSTRLSDTLSHLAAKRSDISPTLINECVEQAHHCIANEFVPIMPDLRWDQFLKDDDSLHALVDLDAFVFAPRELELVLLEYLLTEEQIPTFVDIYTQYHDIPNLEMVRKPYRLLLFMMHVLGEENIDAWMQAPTRF